MINREQFIRAFDGATGIKQTAEELGISEKYVHKLVNKFNVNYVIETKRKIKVIF